MLNELATPAIKTIPTLPHAAFFESATPYATRAMSEMLRLELNLAFQHAGAEPIWTAREKVIKPAFQNAFRDEKDENGRRVSTMFHLDEVALTGVLSGEPPDHILGRLGHDLMEDTDVRHMPYKKLIKKLGPYGRDAAYLMYLYTNIQPDEYGAWHKLNPEEYEAILHEDAAAARGKGDDRKSNFRSFGRLQQKILDHPEFYTPELMQNLPQRVERNCDSTEEWLIPILKETAPSAHPDRFHLHEEIADELQQLVAYLRERAKVASLYSD